MTELAKIFKTALGEIEELSEGINEGEVLQIVDLIVSEDFDKIVGFGAGRMGYALRGFLMRLCHIGFDAYMIGDTNFPKIDARTLVLVNSSSGETPTSLLYAKQAKSEGAFVVGITQNDMSSIGKICDRIIHYPIISSQQIMKTLPEQFTFVLFDVLSEAIIRKTNRCRQFISNNHSISE